MDERYPNGQIEMMKTKTEIINETAQFYSNNQRSVEGGICLYVSGENGERRCAFSRVMNKEGVEVLKNCDLEGAAGLMSRESITRMHFKPGYYHDDGNFWQELQTFHDNPGNWSQEDGGGLTGWGEAKVRDLLGKWGEK